jgi:hypothetical protein
MCLLTSPKPGKSWLHFGLRFLGWSVYAAHVVLLGMTALASQVMVVFVLVVASMLLSGQIGAEKGGSCIGSRLAITAEKRSERMSHKDVCIRLRLTREQEELFISWGLMPASTYKEWWDDYDRIKADVNGPVIAHIPDPDASRYGQNTLPSARGSVVFRRSSEMPSRTSQLLLPNSQDPQQEARDMEVTSISESSRTQHPPKPQVSMSPQDNINLQNTSAHRRTGAPQQSPTSDLQ